MEFCSLNLFNTTTLISVNSNTTSADNVINPDIKYQYTSDGFNNDSTTTTITIAFESTVTVDRIAIMETNVKGFTIYYDGATANTFTIASPTTATDWTSNSATNLYIQVPTPVNLTSVTFDLKTTQSANAEKAVGFLYFGAQELDFERIPSAQDYKPVLAPKEYIQKLADGGVRSHRVAQKWAVEIKYKYITETFRNNLKTIYDLAETRYFVPFGTGSGWDGILFDANWTGPFDFYRYSADAADSGYSGTIRLQET